MPALNATINLDIAALLTSALDLGGANYPLAYKVNYPLTDGLGANQAREMFTDNRALAASASESLDLSGVLLDAFGTAILFTKIKALIIKADPTNVNDVVVGGAGANACFSFFNASTDKVRVKPGGMMCLVAPDVNGYAVTAATADILQVANGGAGTGILYDIIVIGTL